MAVFTNSYYLMRHGQSEANVAGKIVSDPAIGCQHFGLTEQGRQQVVNAIKNYNADPISIIISSDFLRTRQTAQLAAEILSLPFPLLEVALRERFFGNWDGQSDKNYELIWQQDRQGAPQSVNGVEPTEQVLGRGLKLLHKLENSYCGETLLLVSHGDMLQILQTAFAGKKANQHRSLCHHQTAEIKPLVLRGECFPENWSF
ncbi:histidine phosphatase family protein [Motiliproteus sp. MSK22-1]|uniref:histidine phosphatase family protein n=1 Tax=Motiliproteus sp. MSK22-1 TaxID=1897630 RepID=UPI0009781E41|nr:histidine phosphatase family protein [Motiliproteus sp. MSK22-1]OMH32058.1 hypothetical protein BGP75_15220 [Motiliproteus sp. MSK22-1]